VAGAPRPVGPVVTWRPLTRRDVPAVAELHGAARRAEGAPDAVLADDELRHQLDDPGISLERDTLGGWSAAGRLLAYGWVWCRQAPVNLSRSVVAGDVLPEVRRTGVGRALLDWQLERATERLTREVRGGLPRRVDLFAPSDDEGRRALAAGAGMAAIRWFRKMVRPMSDPVRPALAPPGIELAAWSDELAPEVWHHLVGADPRLLRAASRLALADGRVVGFVLCTEQATDEAGAGRTAWLDHIGVRQGWRRRGVASALMAASLVALAEEGYRAAALDVDADNPTGALGLYERHGFRTVRTEVLLARDVSA